MKFLISFLFLPIFAFANTVSEGGQKGFVKIKEGREIYVDWTYARPGQPTVVLVNGLTYTTQQWDRFSDELSGLGVGVLRYDPMGMGETLLKYAPVLADIAVEEQVEDLRLLLKTLKIPQPYSLVGLSYGGGLGLLFASKYPKEIRHLIAMAPYTQPMASQDQWIQSQIWYVRQVQPWNPASDDDLYAFFFRQIVYTTYPTVEPIVLQNPYKLEAVLRLGLGIRKFDAYKASSSLPKNSLYLVIAGKDQYVPRGIMEEFWTVVPQSARACKIIINNSEHKIPEAVPRFSAAIVKEIVTGNPAFKNGQDMKADPYSGEVVYEGGRLNLPKEF
ncbi:MAG: alpha/beta fold hydrolase [Pseudobdellovibrionaceae bacterium]